MFPTFLYIRLAPADLELEREGDIDWGFFLTSGDTFIVMPRL